MREIEERSQILRKLVEHPFGWLCLSAGSFWGLAASPTPFPWWMRVLFVLTPLAIVGVDGLYTVNQFARPVSQLWILGFYYVAIWLIALDMILVSWYMNTFA